MMQPSVDLLVIEDNPADADLITEYLAEIREFSANVICRQDLRTGKGYLNENPVQAVLVDLSLPDSQGLDTVKEIVKHVGSATAIVLTGSDDKELAMKAIELGAQDYVLKGVLRPEILSRVIRYALQRSKSISKLNELQEQLYQSQKIESLGRIAGGVAHDFNNQLGAVTLLCSMIQNKLPDDHPVQGDISKILSVSEKSASLTRRLLAYSRMQPIEASVVDLSDIVSESVKVFKDILPEDISIKAELNKGCFANIDVGLMDQVLMNLAINARDAMPGGGELIFTTSLKAPHSGGDVVKYVVVEVIDSGSGMSKETAKKIFEPFFTTKAPGKGTGLGLSMVYGTVKQSGGEILVESAPGAGTKVQIILPFTTEFRASAGHTSERLAPVQEKVSILLVEDESTLREVTAEILEIAGYDVTSAASGDEALKKFNGASGCFDLIISDMIMPGINGLELRAEVTKLAPRQKFLFTSGYSDEVIDEHGLSPQDFKYLSKPITATRLLEAINEALSVRDGSAPRPSS